MDLSGDRKETIMNRRYLIVSIILLAILTGGALISVIPVSPLLSGSATIPGEPEQTSVVTTEQTPVYTPTTITIPQSTIMPTSPLAIASGSGAVYPYSLSTTALEQQVHGLINQQRAENGLGALSFDPALAGIARNNSKDMAVHHYFSHINPAGQNPTDRGTAANYSCRKNFGSYYTYGIAENLFLNNLYSAATFYSNRETLYQWNSPEDIAQITVADWMNSSGHRENILNPAFDREGIGVMIASEKVYITEDFC
jgi:uncharacterized protein YkwD